MHKPLTYRELIKKVRKAGFILSMKLNPEQLKALSIRWGLLWKSL